MRYMLFFWKLWWASLACCVIGGFLREVQLHLRDRRNARKSEPVQRMFQVGVEGDLFDEHDENADCASSGCRPVTDLKTEALYPK